MKENVEYIKVFADYESDDMPVVYLYEVDLEDERLALRAIEIFADRKVKCIEDFYRDVIEILSIPSVAELNSGEWGGGFLHWPLGKRNLRRYGIAIVIWADYLQSSFWHIWITFYGLRAVQKVDGPG